MWLPSLAAAALAKGPSTAAAARARLPAWLCRPTCACSWSASDILLLHRCCYSWCLLPLRPVKRAVTKGPRQNGRAGQLKSLEQQRCFRTRTSSGELVTLEGLPGCPRAARGHTHRLPASPRLSPTVRQSPHPQGLQSMQMIDSACKHAARSETQLSRLHRPGRGGNPCRYGMGRWHN